VSCLRAALSAICLICFLLSASCGPPSPTVQAPVPASGVVLLDGKPLPHAIVYFIPEGKDMGMGSTGVTNGEGKFELVTVVGAETKPGAPPGNYKVAVSSLVDPKGQPVEAKPNEPPANMGAMESLPPRFSDPSQTEFKAVVPQASGFEFKVSKR
jgi:hypothetical protein